ncbi:hypothetical protein RB2150_05243 [Rhodobacterales bacterium HTCC2150]|nr:hypothetical protein RB2150_05243 [Rhodobacterales bacterium HTCC2150] [Rhodobacteraceae bacterium HTCC2150]
MANTSATPQNPGLFNWFLICLLGVIWGAAFMSVRISLESFGPWTTAALRVTIAASVLALIGRALDQGPSKISASAWPYVFITGTIAVAGPLALLSWGQQYVISAFAGIAMGTVPLLTLPLVAIFSRDEGIGPRRIIGMIVGFIGLAVLIGPGALNSNGNPLEPFGQMACVLAACGYAIGSIVTRRAPRIPPLAFATGALLVATAILLPIAIWHEGLVNSWPRRSTIALMYVAIGPTALAAVIRVRVISTAGSMFMSLTSYMVPAWAALFGVFLMGETLTPNLIYALALILGGIAISQSRNFNKLFRR